MSSDKRPYGAPLKPRGFKAIVRNYFRTTNKEDWNLADLKLRLSITNEQWDAFAADPDYIPTIKYAKAMMESKYLSMLEKKANVGIIFILKSQFGYTDEGIKKLKGEKPSVEGALKGVKVKA